MNGSERAALSALRFNWSPTREDVWEPPQAHVVGLNDNVARAILDGFADAKASDGPSPLGVAITGEMGAGKTHMLSWVRTQVQRDGGYFFLVSLLHGKNFWQNVVHALLSGLRRPGRDGADQLTIALGKLADRLNVPGHVIGTPTPQALKDFSAALRRTDPHLWQECRDTARAMILLAAEDEEASGVGQSYLMSSSEAVDGERRAWGIHPDAKPAHQIVEEISRLLTITGPSMLAVDQIDTLISQSGKPTSVLAGTPVSLPREDLLLDQVGAGLMELREATRRTVTVVSCQPHTWAGIVDRATASIAQRFRQESRLNQVPSAAVGRALVEARFGQRFAGVGFVPPYPTWPVLPDAFADAVLFSPRRLFLRIDAHIRSCLDSGTVVPLATLDDHAETRTPVRVTEQPVPARQFVPLDDRFAELVEQADPSPAVNPATEDIVMPTLLRAGLSCWIEEQGRDRERYSLDPPPGAKPALHVRLYRMLDERTEDEIHWSFRSTAHTNDRALQTRIVRAQSVAGLDPEVTKRKLFLLRTGEWGRGPKTRRLLAEFIQAGGVVLVVEPEDLRTFAALDRMLAEGSPELAAWLRQRRPAGRTALFRAVFGEPEPDSGEPAPLEGPEPPVRDDTLRHEPTATHTLALGNRLDDGSAVQVAFQSLRKHTAIFAGSGSGKTVLIRRLIEECALQGVSAIVLDPNNDLARLGDAWPEPPATWGSGDATKAADYLANTDVVIWTPRREAGRPLSFQPLPDFAAVRDDPDEFALALDTAVAALAPRARTEGATAKAERGRAVLREALAYYARHGGTGLNGYLDLLAELPDDVTPLAKAAAMAADLAQTLTAAMINDPLFGGSGVSLDPGVLLTPDSGKRARISVISFIGLPTNQQRQSFVNQLQMALFAWIKQHPAGDRPLGGLFVMDEAQTLAPSGAMTACTESTLALASQARKYGLGLVFATQAPRGIHNRIVGNAAMQFYGFLNSPTQIAAAKEMAAAKASGVVDISRLTAGQFYAVGEGMPFQKVATPMCLSHHPPSALTAEEVLARARGGA
jgi:hypothetical protein